MQFPSKVLGKFYWLFCFWLALSEILTKKTQNKQRKTPTQKQSRSLKKLLQKTKDNAYESLQKGSQLRC